MKGLALLYGGLDSRLAISLAKKGGMCGPLGLGGCPKVGS